MIAGDGGRGDLCCPAPARPCHAELSVGEVKVEPLLLDLRRRAIPEKTPVCRLALEVAHPADETREPNGDERVALAATIARVRRIFEGDVHALSLSGPGGNCPIGVTTRDTPKPAHTPFSRLACRSVRWGLTLRHAHNSNHRIAASIT